MLSTPLRIASIGTISYLITRTIPITKSISQHHDIRMVKTLPFADIEVPVPGFGAMGLSYMMGSKLTAEEAEPVLLKAIELGCTFWDTAVSIQNCFQI